MLSSRGWIQVMGLVLCVTGVARAEPTATEKETARSLMNEGDRCIEIKDLACAVKAYGAADRIMHLPTTGLPLVESLAASGALLEARDRAREIQRSAPAPGEPPIQATSRERAGALAIELDERLPSLSIKRFDAPRDLSVTLDGTPVLAEAVFLARKVNPGKHLIEASAPGYADAHLELTLSEKENREATLVMLPGVSAKAKPTTPALPGPDVGPAPKTPLPQDTSSGTLGIPFWITAGVGVLGIGTGAITGLMAMSKANQVKSTCLDKVCPTSNEATLDASRTLGNVSTAAFIVGGLGAAGAVTLLLLRPESPAKTARTRIFPGLGSIALEGTF